MNKLIKSAALSGLISGLMFALIMGAFDYFEGVAFNPKKTIFQIVFFGTFMGIWNYFTLKRKEKRENQQN